MSATKKQKLTTSRVKNQIDMVSSDDEETSVKVESHTAVPDRSQQVCTACHKPKTRKEIMVGSKRVTLSHAQVCEMECTNVKCTHRSHASRKNSLSQKSKRNQQQQRSAILAGFKPDENDDFNKVLKKKLQAAGMEKSPSPAQLSVVIEAAKQYSMAHRTPSRPFSESTSASYAPPDVINSVLNLLERTDKCTSAASTLSTLCSQTSASQAKTRFKLQCNHCSFVYDEDMDVAYESNCSMCTVGVLHRARVGATTNLLVFRSAIDMAKQSELKASQTSQAESTTNVGVGTRCSSAEHSRNSGNEYEWPPGKNCDVCCRIIAVKYCANCMSYLCGSSACADKLHGSNAAENHGCDESHINDMNATTVTRSGKVFTASTVCTNAQLEQYNEVTDNNEANDIDGINVDIDDEDDVNKLPYLLLQDQPKEAPTCTDKSTQTVVVGISVSTQTTIGWTGPSQCAHLLLQSTYPQQPILVRCQSISNKKRCCWNKRMQIKKTVPEV